MKELQDLKNKKEGKEGPRKYDRGNAVVTIISGAGGDDAEDFSAMLLQMYLKYAGKQGWSVSLIHENKNEHGGYRNVAFETQASPRLLKHPPLSIMLIMESGRRDPYGTLKHESGVHRLVRISPFNAKNSATLLFSLVEVLPKFSKLEEKDIVISDADLKIEFSRSSGPGGQNVNKRETAVRVVHVPSGLSVHASGERSQEQNREQALAILRAKIFKRASSRKNF